MEIKEDIKRIYDLFSDEKDKPIPKKNLDPILACLGIELTKKEYKDFGSKFMLDDLYDVVYPKLLQKRRDGLYHVFRDFDKKKIGRLDKSLIVYIVCNIENLSRNNIETLIKMVDIHGDGIIDYEEFIKSLYN